MMIRFACVCGRTLTAEDPKAGHLVSCPQCGIGLRVPSPPLQRGPAIRIESKDLEQPSPVASSSLPQPTTPDRLPVSSTTGAAPASSVSPAGPPPGPLPTTMRANRRFEGKVCPICQAQIRLGEDLRICEHCQSPFHRSCWEENGGCGTYGCAGAATSKPRQSYADFSIKGDQLSPPPSAGPTFGAPAPAYQAPTLPPSPGFPQTSGLAIASLVLSLLGLCGIGSLLGVIFGHQALANIDRSQGMVTGRGMAIAGLILGYLGLAGVLLIILICANQ
jgi:hypothetical protein